MYRDRFGRRSDYGSGDGRRRRWPRWPRSRAAGCLLWIVLLVVLLIVLSVMFGGFQKGTQYKGLGLVPALGSHPSIASQGSAVPVRAAAWPTHVDVTL
jgi:hypothetical protein